MKKKRIPGYFIVLISVGLFMTTSPMLLARYMAIPDFLRGGLTGIGLAIEVMGLILLKRGEKSDCVS